MGDSDESRSDSGSSSDSDSDSDSSDAMNFFTNARKASDHSDNYKFYHGFNAKFAKNYRLWIIIASAIAFLVCNIFIFYCIKCKRNRRAVLRVESESYL